MSAQPELHLIVELEQEAARWRRRSMFLLSIILHAVLIIILLVSPKLFRRGAEMLGVVQEPDLKSQATFLVMPPDLEKLRQAPPTDNLSDKNRRAQGHTPKIDPNGVPMPYLRGNSPLPEIAGGAVPKPPAAAPSPPAGQPNPPQPGSEAQPQPAEPALPPAPKKDDGLKLSDVTADSGGSQGQRVRLPVTTPGQAIQQSLEAAVRGRSSGPVPGPGDSTEQFNNLSPNFSTEAPVVLSDTKGVDFGPYLARIVYIVKRNWYAVIPESARLGEKGRVTLVFEILKDGSVPQLRLIGPSGAEPLDRAAINSIRASNPFPPLPAEFTGNHLVLQFTFLYNLAYSQ